MNAEAMGSYHLTTINKHYPIHHEIFHRHCCCSSNHHRCYCYPSYCCCPCHCRCPSYCCCPSPWSWIWCCLRCWLCCRSSYCRCLRSWSRIWCWLWCCPLVDLIKLVSIYTKRLIV